MLWSYPRKQTEIAELACTVPQPQKTDKAALSCAPSLGGCTCNRGVPESNSGSSPPRSQWL
jgi:hypothetical protein